MNTKEQAEEWLVIMSKYLRVHNYSPEMKSHLDIYNLNGKVAIWWRDLKHSKKYEAKEIQ